MVVMVGCPFSIGIPRRVVGCRLQLSRLQLGTLSHLWCVLGYALVKPSEDPFVFQDNRDFQFQCLGAYSARSSEHDPGKEFGGSLQTRYFLTM